MYNPSRTLSVSGSSADNSAWYHLTSKILDIIILETESEQVWESLYRFRSSGCMKMLTDHVRNLSSSLESVVFLSTLLFDTYSFQELNVRVENLLQCRRYHYIQHVTIWEICSPKNWLRCTRFVNWLCFLNFCDPWHRDLRIRCLRTNFSLEIDFPAFKFHGVREFCKMQLRDWKSRVLHHTTVRISSTSMTWNSIYTVEDVSRIG